MEYLYLKWIDYKTDKKHLIGALFRDKEKGKYYQLYTGMKAGNQNAEG